MQKNDIDKDTELAAAAEYIGTVGTDQPQEAEVAEATQPEGVQKELSTVSNADNSKPEDGAENTELDSESKTGADDATGSEAGSEVTSVTVPVLDLIPDKAEQKAEEEMEKVAKQLFLDNPLKEAVYFSSDLIPFFEKSDAYKYSGTLEDKAVRTITRN